MKMALETAMHRLHRAEDLVAAVMRGYVSPDLSSAEELVA
jgi:hypothetical protein